MPFDGFPSPYILRPRQIPTVPVEIIPGHPLARGLAGYWLLNRPGVARDLGPFKVNGTAVGTPTLGGSSVGPLTSLGTGNYFNLGTYSGLNGATAFTVAALVIKPAGNFANHSGIVGFGPGGASTTRLPWIWGLSGAQTIQAQIDVAGTLKASTTTAAIPSNVPVWIIITWNGATLTAYVNGAPSGTPGASSISVLPSNPGTDYIGYIDSYSQWPGQIGPVLVSTHCFSAAEVVAFYAAPFSMLRPIARRTYWSAPASGDLVVSPGAGSIAIAGQAPSADATVAPGIGSIIITGHAPTADSTVAPGAGSITITGHAPSADAAVAPGGGNITLTGYTPTLSGFGVVVSPGSGLVTLTGHAPTLNFGTRGGAADRAWRKYLDWHRKRKRQSAAPATKRALSKPPIESEIIVAPVAPALPSFPLEAIQSLSLRLRAEIAMEAFERDEEEALLLLMEDA